mgnify:CR=1 FL=1
MVWKIRTELTISYKGAQIFKNLCLIKTIIIHLKISNIETEQKTKYSTYEILLITTKLNLLRFFMYVFRKELMCHWMRAVLSFLVKCSYFLMFSNISQNAILRKNQNSLIINYVNFSLSGAFTHVGWFCYRLAKSYIINRIQSFMVFALVSHILNRMWRWHVLHPLSMTDFSFRPFKQVRHTRM